MVMVMPALFSNEEAFKSHPYPMDLENLKMDLNWDDVSCSICLNFPHNGVLLHCSSYKKGCRPFICDTDQNHSNCLERFKNAYKIPAAIKVTSTNGVTVVCFQGISSSTSNQPTCPLCRGAVTGWLIIDEARVYLNMKERCCEEKHCTYMGNFFELQKHAKVRHPYSCPSKIDPVRKLDWENFQQSSEIIDVLSTIHAEAPRAVVLGDYVIEYGDSEAGDEYIGVRRNRGRWWSSLLSRRLIPRFGCLRIQRRSHGDDRSRHGPIADVSYMGEAFSSFDIREYRFAEADNELAQTGVSTAPSLVIPSHYRWEFLCVCPSIHI